MTAEEPHQGASIAADADQERWLTYLNYDPAIGQAVRRLGALSSENVDLFRSLLLKGRDRGRVAEYEAESIRRLQGEAFVGDEELQRALIVLHAEDPRLGAELKRVVAAEGKPAELDQTIAAIRSQTKPPKPDQPEPSKAEQSKIAAIPLKVVPPPAPPRGAPKAEIPKSETPKEAPQESSKESSKEFLRAAFHEPRANAPGSKPPAGEPKVKEPKAKEAAEPKAASPQIRQVKAAPQESQPRRLVLAAAVLVIAAIGLAFAWFQLGPGNTAKTASSNMAQPVPSPNESASPTASPSPNPPAPRPEVQAAMQAQAVLQSSAKQAPVMRPASDSADKPAPPASSSAAASPVPVPGSPYKVVKGDMLSAIALKAYRDASKFPLIQKANPSLRNTPNLILVDQVIFIPPAS